MNCEEIKKSVEDYLDDLLDEKTLKDFEDSLPYCEEEKGYVESVKSLADKLGDLPLSFEPPKEIISELTDKLMKMSETEVKSHVDKDTLKKIDDRSRKHKPKPKEKKKLNLLKGLKEFNFSTFGFILTGLTTVLILLVFYLITFFDDTSPWRAGTNKGIFRLNNETAASADIYAEDIISTESTGAFIVIRDEANIGISPNTSLQIMKTKKSLNRISLQDGGISYEGISESPNFELLYNNISIKALKCRFNARIDSVGKLNVEGIEGYVEVVTSYDRFYLSHDYICTISGNISDIPYHVNASAKLKHQLKNLQANINDLVELTSLLYDASYKDAFTLLRLIELVPRKNREIIFEKLKNLYPPTPNVTKAGILDGNRNMLDEWWFEIEWQI